MHFDKWMGQNIFQFYSRSGIFFQHLQTTTPHIQVMSKEGMQASQTGQGSNEVHMCKHICVFDQTNKNTATHTKHIQYSMNSIIAVLFQSDPLLLWKFQVF